MPKSRSAVLVMTAAVIVAVAVPRLAGPEPHRRVGAAGHQSRHAAAGHLLARARAGTGLAGVRTTATVAHDAAQFASSRRVMRAALAARLAAIRRARAAHRRHRPFTFRLCRRFQHVRAFGTHGAGLVVRNDSYGGRRECLANVNRWANFAVASSVRRGSVEPVAFPNIFYGCSWGVCSPRTRLPRRLSRLRNPATSWYTTGHPPGRWDVAYDIWFARKRFTSGQDHGAEIMLWLRTSGLGRPRTAHSLLIDRRRWQLMRWITRSPATGDRWPLIIFRMIHPRGYVRHLALMPFFRRVQALGLLHRSWWLTAVEAGFEVWRGGRGLRTTSFWVRA